MQNEWIVDVLADLKAFAQNNGMNVLAEQLDDTRLVAVAELAVTGEGKSTHDSRTAAAVGQPFEYTGRRI